jgi:hypothetical protein
MGTPRCITPRRLCHEVVARARALQIPTSNVQVDLEGRAPRVPVLTLNGINAKAPEPEKAQADWELKHQIPTSNIQRNFKVPSSNPHLPARENQVGLAVLCPSGRTAARGLQPASDICTRQRRKPHAPWKFYDRTLDLLWSFDLETWRFPNFPAKGRRPRRNGGTSSATSIFVLFLSF